jgi:NADH pyrophosphatase NudC (nudix superfamily)
MPHNPDVQILQIGDLPIDDPVRRAREGFERGAQEMRTGSHSVYTPPAEQQASRPTDTKLPEPPTPPPTSGFLQNYCNNCGNKLETAQILRFCNHCGSKLKASQALTPAEAPAVIIHIYPGGDIKVIRNGQQTLVTSQP